MRQQENLLAHLNMLKAAHEDNVAKLLNSDNLKATQITQMYEKQVQIEKSLQWLSNLGAELFPAKIIAPSNGEKGIIKKLFGHKEN